ncbi:hypothetical protein [Rahnella variigena]|uniref:hypothetical protein n=1 Tax=Rahnella variigena TaxID=574964 RepID=UPI0028DC6AB1|nr:hypothetical protein [Rahnella variigena]
MTDTTDIAVLMLKMRTLADRIIDAEGENNNGEVGKIIEMYDTADTTFKAQNILLVLNAFEAERHRPDLFKFAFDEWLEKTDWVQARKKFPFQNLGMHRADVMTTYIEHLEADNAALKTKLANPVLLPAGYSARAGHPFHEGERNVMIPNKNGDWLSRFEVEHAIHVAGFPFTVKGE